MGTCSGKKLSGSLVGGRTGGTFTGKLSAAAVIIKLDFPVPRSPATTIRTVVRPPVFTAPAGAFVIETAKAKAKSKTLITQTNYKSHQCGQNGVLELKNK